MSLSFLRSWAWKREHRSDRERFEEAVSYLLHGDGASPQLLTIEQAPFNAEGFASTVWDSSIVTSRFFERWPELVAGKLCLDLSAGCGLVGIVLAHLGGLVTATDLQPNLPLLIKNAANNGAADPLSLRVEELAWGAPVQHLQAPFDIVVACDVMYIPEAVEPLVHTLKAVTSPASRIYLAHGRNQQAREAFLEACEGVFSVKRLKNSEMDEVYRCDDVEVLLVRRLKSLP